MTRRLILETALLVALVTMLFVDSSSTPGRYDLPDGLGTVDAVSELAARHVHGWDDQLPAAELDAVAADRRIVATCGYVSAWAVRVLEREGFEARMVHTLTLDEWDDRNNGHTMLEAKLEGRWVLFDVDRDVWYWRDGRPLSLVELVDVVPSDDYEIRPLSGDPVDLAAIRADDARLLQVPLVEVDGEQIFYSADVARVESYSPTYRALDAADWLERFYGTEVGS